MGIEAALIGGGLGLAGSFLGGREQRKGMEAAAEAARFRPMDITTPLGGVDASETGYTASLSPELQQRMQGLLGMSSQQLQAAQSPQAGFDYISQLYGPQLERQRASQESRLFNQGLLGTTTGGLQTEALSRAQNQALLEAGMAQQNQSFERGLGLLGSALDIGNIPSQQIATSGNISSGVSAAGANAGQFIAQGGAQRGNQIASIFSGLGQAAGGFIGRNDPANYLIGSGGSAAPPPSARSGGFLGLF